MPLPDKIFKPERYTYQDYLLWKGDWELVNGYPYAMAPSPVRSHQCFQVNLFRRSVTNWRKIDLPAIARCIVSLIG